MIGHMLLAHLVDLKSGSLRRCRRIGNTCGNHRGTPNSPFTLRHFPVQRTISLHLPCQVYHLFRIPDTSTLTGFCRSIPHIFVPHGQRTLEHLAQGLLLIAFHQRLVAHSHTETDGPGAAFECQTEVPG